MKKNIKLEKTLIIATLCIAICIMTVGFAIFSTQLKISGTSNIASTWKVLFTNIEQISITDGVKVNEIATATGTNAKFNVSLSKPGDKVVYKITVANQGTLNAMVNDIKINDTGSDAVIFEVDGIQKGDLLEKQTSTTFNIIIKYDESITSQPSVLENTLTVNINYVQNKGQEVAGVNPNITPTSLAAKILSDNDAQSDLGMTFNKYVDFGSTTSNYSGLFYTNRKTEDNKTTYYFRGNVDNNYVKFGKDIRTGNDIIWRIVRINEDGSVRLVTENSVGRSAFNGHDYQPESVGYMHSGEDIYTNEEDSEMKDYLDDWYINKTNLNDYAYLMSNNAGFCNDRTPGKGYYSSNEFASTSRIYGLNQPQFACPNEERDLFTLGTSSLGNKKLTYPVGLLTLDEVIYAGGLLNFDYDVNNFYLLQGNFNDMSTMTPYHYAFVHFIESYGYISSTTDPVDMDKDVRPVINVNFNASVISGDGRVGSEYVIQ